MRSCFAISAFRHSRPAFPRHGMVGRARKRSIRFSNYQWLLIVAIMVFGPIFLDFHGFYSRRFTKMFGSRLSRSFGRCFT